MEILGEVKLATGSKTLVSRIETLSKKNKTFLLILLFLSISTIFIPLLTEMHFPVVEKIKFNKNDAISDVRKLIVTINGINAFSRFLSINIFLTREEFTNYYNETDINMSLTTREYSGNRADETFRYNNKIFNFVFEKGSNKSKTLNIYNSSAVDCSKFEGQVFMKFQKNNYYSGVVEASFQKQSISIFQVIVRITFLIVSIIIFFAIIPYKKIEVENKTIINMMIFLDASLVLASNVLYSLSYLSASQFFPTMQQMMDSFLFYTALYTTFIIIVARSKNREIECLSYLSNGVIFIVCFLINCVYICFLKGHDDLTFRLIVYAAEAICAIICLYSIFSFKTDETHENEMFAKLLFITVAVEFYCKMSDYKCMKLYHLSCGADIYSFMIVGLYVIFVNYILWPTKESDQQMDLEVESSNQDE